MEPAQSPRSTSEGARLGTRGSRALLGLLDAFPGDPGRKRPQGASASAPIAPTPTDTRCVTFRLSALLEQPDEAVPASGASVAEGPGRAAFDALRCVTAWVCVTFRVMRGVPIPPAELARAAEVYATTGNAAAAARAVGRDPDVVRRALQRSGAVDRLLQQRRAVDRALRRAQRLLSGAIETAADAIAENVVPSPLQRGKLLYRSEPIARLTSELSRATETLARVAESIERRRVHRAARRRLLAEVAAMRPPELAPAPVVVVAEQSTSGL